MPLHICCGRRMRVRKDAPDVRVMVCQVCEFEVVQLQPDWRWTAGDAA